MASRALILVAGILGLGCQRVFDMIRPRYICLCVLFLIGCLLCYFWFKAATPELSFASSKWVAASARERGSMVKDLLTNYRDDLKDTQSVAKVLGKPDKQTHTEWTYKVDIGHKLGGSPWAYKLIIKFDNERVSEILLLD